MSSQWTSQNFLPETMGGDFGRTKLMTTFINHFDHLPFQREREQIIRSRTTETSTGAIAIVTDKQLTYNKPIVMSSGTSDTTHEAATP